jgi:hypothetical protein
MPDMRLNQKAVSTVQQQHAKTRCLITQTFVLLLLSALPLLAQTVETNSLANADGKTLLAAIPELEWTQDYMIANGWMKPGQIVSKKAMMFSKTNYTLLGVTGEIIFNFNDTKQFPRSGYSLWLCFELKDAAVGSTKGDGDFVSLYKALAKICTSPEQRRGLPDRSRSRIEWTEIGATNQYSISLDRRVRGDVVERCLEIYVSPKGSKIEPIIL